MESMIVITVLIMACIFCVIGLGEISKLTKENKARKSPHKTAYNKRVKKSIITKTPMFYLLLIYKIKNARERASPKRWCFFLRKKH